MDPKAKIVEVVARKLPLNKLGLPDGIFRPDLLPIPPALLAQPAEIALPTEPEATEGEPMFLADIAKPEKDDADKQTVSSDTVAKTAEDCLETDEPNPPQTVDIVAPWDPASSKTTDEDIAAFDAAALQQKRDMALLETLKGSQIQFAYVPLDYTEGFPAMPSGLPFWEQFEWESADQFRAFQHYVKMSRKGQPRQLYRLAEVLLESADFRGGSPPNLKQLQDMFHLNYWKWRCLSYDLFRAAYKRRKEVFSLERMQTNHQKMANTMMKRLQLHVEDEEFWETMTPQVAVKLLDTLIKWQRLNAGVPVNGVSPQSAHDQSGAGVTGLEVILRQIASSAGVNENSGQAIDQGGAIQEDFRQSVMSDPKAINAAQELVIKMSMSQGTRTEQHGVTI